MDDAVGGFEIETTDNNTPKAEAVEKQTSKIEVKDGRGEKADVIQTAEFKTKLENDKVEEKLTQFENLVGKYTKQKVSEGFKINVVYGSAGNGEVVDGVLSVNLPTQNEIDIVQNDERAKPFLDVLTKAGTTYKEFSLALASSTTIHESEHMIIDSRPNSQLARDFESAQPLDQKIILDEAGHALSLLDEGITYAFQMEIDSGSELFQKLEGDKPPSEESFTISTRKRLGEILRPKLKEYIDNGNDIDGDFLKFAGEEMKKLGIEKYVAEAENERREKMVWREAEPVLNDWEGRLASYEEKHRTQISKSLGIMAHLFGKNTPEKINVDLHYLARRDSSKGEPVSNLVDNNLLAKNDTDVIYWLGKVTRLSSDGPEQIEEEERRQTAKIIHEMIHQDFQSENSVFKDVLNESNNNPEIIELRKELMSGQANYLEPEAELTAIYLEQYADKILKEETSNDGTSTSQQIIDYRLDNDRFQEIFNAVIEADDAEKWKDGGPYRSTHDGWKGLYTEKNENIVSTAPEASNQPRPPHELSIYELGTKITDFSLIEKYVIEGKQMDLLFVKELYKLFLAQKNTR
ncbi:MAG: hypothetical protein WA052_02345 [Microgenomates group bacterium]